jgi:HSP20 family protein
MTMLTRFTDFDRLFGWSELDDAFGLLDAFRRDAARWWGTEAEAGDSWLRANLFDNGSALVFQADVPGFADNDIQVSLNQDILTVSGERTVASPEGYRVHRRERPVTRFSRSFRLNSPVDAEKTMARVEQGVLTVTLPKAPEAQPRRISVQTA